MGTTEHPRRRCGVGGDDLEGTCGAIATAVCTDARGFQWFACDNAEHRRAFYQCDGKHLIAVDVTPIAEWFARLFARDP